MTIRALAGDLDLVGGEESGKLIYLENTGSSRTPEFVERIGTANPFDGIDVGVYSAPALGDLDGDGDLDLVVGEESGKLIYIENTGTSTEPEFAEFVAFLDFSPKSSYSYSYSYLYDDDYDDDDDNCNVTVSDDLRGLRSGHGQDDGAERQPEAVVEEGCGRRRRRPGGDRRHAARRLVCIYVSPSAGAWRNCPRPGHAIAAISKTTPHYP